MNNDNAEVLYVYCSRGTGTPEHGVPDYSCTGPLNVGSLIIAPPGPLNMGFQAEKCRTAPGMEPT